MCTLPAVCGNTPPFRFLAQYGVILNLTLFGNATASYNKTTGVLGDGSSNLPIPAGAAPRTISVSAKSAFNAATGTAVPQIFLSPGLVQSTKPSSIPSVNFG